MATRKNMPIICTKHWGEIEPAKVTTEIDVSEEITLAMKSTFLADHDPQPKVTQHIQEIKLPPTDPLVSYAIALHKYLNEMKDMIDRAKTSIDRNLPCEEEIPPIPPMPRVERKHNFNCLNVLPKGPSAFSLGTDLDLEDLNPVVLREISIKCLAIMFAHVGFEDAFQSTLDVSADVLQAFFNKIARHLKVAAEDEEEHNTTFSNSIERVLIEIGLGGIKGLHDYYQCRVVKYVNVLYKRCKNLHVKYENLLKTKETSPSSETDLNLKDENDISEENPEVHLLDDDLECSALEPGYQILCSLEAENGFQHLIEPRNMNSVVSFNEQGDGATSAHGFYRRKRDFLNQ